MLSLSRKAFERLVEQAYREIPKQFRDLAGNVQITVQDRPGEEAEGMEHPEELLGLYLGPDKQEFESPLSGTELPPRIVLYQSNLQAICDDEDWLKDEIKLTLRHELAHYFGFSDEELHEKWPEGA